MTEITVEKYEMTVRVRVENHCKNRDVCIAISAIASTLCQYTQFFRDERGGVRVDELRYERGNVEIVVKCTPKTLTEYLKGARAIMLGFELYAANYPDDVRVHMR